MRLFMSCVFAMLLLSCGETEKKPSPQEFNNKSVQFYPLKQFLDSQIHEVAATPYFIYKLTKKQQSTDSVVITSNQFLDAADEFLKDSIEDSASKKFYKETVFHDNGIQTFTFNYTCFNPALRLQSADVLLDDNTQKVKRVFLSKTEKRNDTLTEIKLGWKTGESFFIYKTTYVKKQKPITEQTTVVWNEKQIR